MIAFMMLVGIALQYQLPAVLQSLLSAPLQVPAVTSVIITSSVDAVQGLFEIVHLKV